MPALSFLDLAWARLGVDPIARGVRVVDGQRFEVEAAGERGPLLVAQCDSAHVLSDIKLALDAGDEPALAAGGRVVVLQRLGTDDEQIFEVAWDELDRWFAPDHLTSVYLPELAAPVGRRGAALRRAGRHPAASSARGTASRPTSRCAATCWRRATRCSRRSTSSTSPRRAAAATTSRRSSATCCSRSRSTPGWRPRRAQFTLADVARGVHDKLVARHPHVFGDVHGRAADDVVANWEQIKKAEKGRESVFDGIPAAMPALLFALKVQKKAATLELGVEDGDIGGAAIESLTTDELGELLWEVVDRARRLGLDPEDALRKAASAHRDQLREAEQTD